MCSVNSRAGQRSELVRCAALIGYASQMEQDQAELSRTVDLVLPAGLALASRQEAAGIPTLFPDDNGRLREEDVVQWIPTYTAQ